MSNLQRGPIQRPNVITVRSHALKAGFDLHDLRYYGQRRLS